MTPYVCVNCRRVGVDTLQIERAELDWWLG